MNIGVPRYIVVGLAGLFSCYHLVTAVYELHLAASLVGSLLAMLIYAAATVLVLLPWRQLRVPRWVAVLVLAAAAGIPLLVVGLHGDTSFPRWYVPAIGTLMTVLAVRRRAAFAWTGIGFLAVLTDYQAGIDGVLAHGVGIAISWVAVAHLLSRAMLKADADARRFARAEREAAEWQAAQEAHVFERQFRLGQTSSMALAMLRRIERSGGELTDEERRECLHLEGAIRDEIRGRRLLNDDVREQVMRQRRRGAVVTLLDEGGIDDMADGELTRVLTALADALRDADADRIVARTVPEGSDVAVTVVGLRGEPDALEDGDDEMVLWLEIPR